MTRLFATLALLWCLGTVTAFADEPPAKPDEAAAAAKAPDGFEPVKADMMERGESIPASTLVGCAYGFIFASVLVWVATVVSRQRRVEAEMQELERKLAAKGK
jgi:hypothetical protein